MEVELRKILKFTDPAPTIGQHNVSIRRMPVHNRYDFYDTFGRLQGLLVVAPILLGMAMLALGFRLGLGFWLFAAATAGYLIFFRRPPFLRLTAIGISFPDSHSPVYSWNQMTEARARAEDLEIVMANGLRFEIPFRKMQDRDIRKLKRLIKAQFAAMADLVKKADAAQGEAR